MARRSTSARRGKSAGPAAGDASSMPHTNKSSFKKKSGAWAEPTPAEIERIIHESLLAVVISLEISEDKATDTKSPAPTLQLLECSLNSWQELVQLQRVVDSLQRPTRPSNGDGQEEEMLECMVFGSLAKPELQLSPSAVNSVHRFSTTLVLRLQSLGLCVRSLLQDRVLVRLPADFAPVNTRKIIPWQAIVVAPVNFAPDANDPSEWIQRVVLPPLQVKENPLAHLYYPQLISMVDDMLEDHTQTGRVHVVILRGIPGSGKSSLGRDIISICKARNAKAMVCSADLFFETSRGYRFNVKDISTAHERSQKTCRDALAAKTAAVIVVDNTHTQRWEYEPYETMAMDHNSPIHILEMHCPDVPTCTRMAQRNSHGVGVVKVLAMYVRWEADSRATLFHPRFLDAFVLANPVTRNPVNNYVAYVGLFLDPATRAQVLHRVKPRHANVVAEHITLLYRPTSQYIRQAPIGRKFKVRIVGIVEDSKGQTLEIKLDDRLMLTCRNKTPHITVSTAQGVNAFYSNELLEDSKATRTPVEDAWEIDVTLGVALMAQHRKIMTLTSPFQHQFHHVTTHATEDVPSPESPSEDSVVVLDVDASELLAVRRGETVERTLLRQQIVRHSSGPHATSRRVVAVRNAHESETQVLAAVHNWLSPSWTANSLRFDTVVFVTTGETLASALLAISPTPKHMTVLTTQPPSAVKDFIGLEAGASIKQLPGISRDDPVSRLSPSLDSSLTRTLDAMGVATTEEACFITQTAIEVAEAALTKCGVYGATVERVDSALWSHRSSMVEIATAMSTTDCAVDDLVAAIKSYGIRDVTVVEMSIDEERDVSLQFQLPTTRPQTPTIRWRVANSSSGSASTRLSHRLQLVSDIRHHLRDTLRPELQDLYPHVASVIGAVLRGQVNLKSASSSAILQLLSERAVLAFFTTETSPDPLSAEGKTMDHCLMWSQIVKCLDWLASWIHEQWKREVMTIVDSVAVMDEAITDELAKQVGMVMKKASAHAADNGEYMSEKTRDSSWGRKLTKVLLSDVQG